MTKVLIVGDIHLRTQLPYHDYVKGGRDEEKQKVLNFIIEQGKGCDKIIFLGDCYDAKNPSSDTVKEFTAFLERFNNKQKIYLLTGNHELKAGGTSSLDYLNEIKEKNWQVIKGIEKIEDMIFCSYHTKQSLEVNTNEEGQDKLMKLLPNGKILFVHQAVSDSLTSSGQNTNLFNEIVLSKKELEKQFGLVVGGHVHQNNVGKKCLIAGSVFPFEVNEVEKFIYKLDEETLDVETIKLPVRAIHKLENPTEEDLEKIDKSSILKVIISEKLSNNKITELKKKLKEFDAYVFLEKIPKERKKIHYSQGESLLEFSIPQLLKVYADEKSVEVVKLMRGFELIKN